MPDAALINFLLVTLALGVATIAAKSVPPARIKIPVYARRRRPLR